MKRLFAEPLRKHTTFKIGGPVEVLSIPESEEELIKEIQGLKIGGTSYRLLGKGSNLLVSDKGLKGVVIKNTRACLDLNKNGNIVTVGSSVSLPAFVKFCVNNDLEGMEFLCSIPATVGGALYMNAGLGRHMKSVISDKLVSVKFFDGAEIKEIEK